jgi:hypothetical protein
MIFWGKPEYGILTSVHEFFGCPNAGRLSNKWTRTLAALNPNSLNPRDFLLAQNLAEVVLLSPVMTNIDAMRILQHASFYIFSTRVVGGPGKTMRASVDVWQAMATLDHCRSELLNTQIEGASQEESENSVFSRTSLKRNAVAGLMLCCL